MAGGGAHRERGDEIEGEPRVEILFGDEGGVLHEEAVLDVTDAEIEADWSATRRHTRQARKGRVGDVTAGPGAPLSDGGKETAFFASWRGIVGAEMNG